METLPLYEYRCTQCGNRYEKIQSFSTEPDTTCPKCGGKVERPLTAPALQFKGAGWYINDYAPKAASGSSSASGESSTSESKAAESKGSELKASESKPAESAPAAQSKASSPAPSAASGASGNS